ncbi:AAA domain-containing protein [Streptomyces sp. RTGN2]|uniref:AAA domain-containing protein n=1 Tax=Streptomyces sp. RTGN2 TaxID=3016525 RepID=UPI002556A485|nr:AAA domain-containing protein [Streptomyces sp. RTGN2]
MSEIGEFVRHQSCQRRFKLDSNRRRLTRRLPFAERLFNPLDYVLSARGKEQESHWEQELQEAGFSDAAPHMPSVEESGAFPSWDDFAAALERLDGQHNAFGREIRLAGSLGAFDVEGRADFLVLLWRGGRPVLRVVECKASRRDRTYQRLQVAFYALLIKERLAAHPLMIAGERLDPDSVECVVARIDAETNERQQIMSLVPLDLSLEEADALRLVASDGTLAGIMGTELDDLGYQLDAKCDGCVFSVDCLTESARQRRHELLGISAPTAAALRQAGIRTIDELAEIDSDDPRARVVRADPGFTEPVERLRTLAAARRSTLPGGDENPDNFRVQAYRPSPTSQLPEYEQDGQRVVRVYLSVDYDYTENRIGAVAAHITKSDGAIHTLWTGGEGEDRKPSPDVAERVRTLDSTGQKQWGEPRPVQGKSIVHFQSSEWSGEYLSDTGSERQILQSFFSDLTTAIAEISDAGDVKLHFYVWSRSEMSRLVEACSRTSGKLLSALRELLGCRESLEQLIYSCVQDEVNSRYALGWTGRGLSVVTSLPWFGRSYHWRRRVAGQEVDLDKAFTQDIFDFKTSLGIDGQGNWAKGPKDSVFSHRFEIRSRFHDSLPAPYWHAAWDTLPDPDNAAIEIPANTRNAIRRYQQAGEIGMLKEYLKARILALRWVEEAISFKNSDIIKPTLQVADLRRFTLGVNDVAAAGIDFLRLDHFVKLNDWTATNIQPPASRVPTGRTLPLASVQSFGKGRLTATIVPAEYGLELEELRNRSPFQVGSMCRVNPCGEDIYRGQSIRQLRKGGRTGTIKAIDWATGEIEIEEFFNPESRYVLQGGYSRDAEPVFDFATLDESPSDYVAGRVEDRLKSAVGSHVYPWLDPERPKVTPRSPLTPAEAVRWQAVVGAIQFQTGFGLSTDQAKAVIEGLDTRMQVLQGPPGTGKTQTTSVAIAIRAAHRLQAGDVVLVAAHTHAAVDTLLKRLQRVLPEVRAAGEKAGVAIPNIEIGRIHSTEIPIAGNSFGATDIRSNSSTNAIKKLSKNGVVVLGGTTAALLKMAKNLNTKATWQSRGGFSVPLLVVDEGSMMVLPHFLALATLVSPDGDVLVAGDHRQLEPIVAHDWDHEDRPPSVVYQPFSSAFNALRGIGAREDIGLHSVRRSALELTFRLPPLITEVIARLYRLDEIELKSLKEASVIDDEVDADADRQGLERVWRGEAGLYLVLHDDKSSRQSNVAELEIIQKVLSSNTSLPEDSVAIITPHRAQRSMLSAHISNPAVGVIDTVERLQGGERPTIIVSGTASDPAAIASNARFLLDLNRSNVAFSRAQERLIVVCARSLLDALPAELEDYHAALLWKSLRSLCTRQVGEGRVSGAAYEVYTVPRQLDH